MKSNSKGFTLLEIIVVMILVAVASSLVFVSVGKSIGKKKDKAFAEDMVSLCKEARFRAIDKGVPAAILISSGERRCWIGGTEKSLEIPEEMLIEGEGVALFQEGVYAVHFYPDGSSSGGELTLSVFGRLVYAFKIDRLTGLISRVEGHA
jgi:general secretion pathway protein H